jgi:hypothetical protein
VGGEGRGCGSAPHTYHHDRKRFHVNLWGRNIIGHVNSQLKNLMSIQETSLKENAVKGKEKHERIKAKKTKTG